MGPLLAHLGAILVPLGYTLSYFVPPELILEPSRHHFGASGDSFWMPNGPRIHHLSGPGGMREAIRRPSGWRAGSPLWASFFRSDLPSLFWLLNPSYNPPQGLNIPPGRSSNRPGAIFFRIFYLDVFWPAFGMPFALLLAAFFPPKCAKLRYK